MLAGEIPPRQIHERARELRQPYKGTLLCKYVSIEMALAHGQVVASPEIWESTLDDEREGAPLRVALEAATENTTRAWHYSC